MRLLGSSSPMEVAEASHDRVRPYRRTLRGCLPVCDYTQMAAMHGEGGVWV